MAPASFEQLVSQIDEILQSNGGPDNSSTAISLAIVMGYYVGDLSRRSGMPPPEAFQSLIDLATSASQAARDGMPLSKYVTGVSGVLSKNKSPKVLN